MPYRKNPNLISKETESGLLLFNADTGRMMELNSTARLLWQKSGDRFGQEDLIGIIAEFCEGGEGASSDIREFVETAKKYDMVSEDG
jgi:hypothetical protein